MSVFFIMKSKSSMKFKDFFDFKLEMYLQVYLRIIVYDIPENTEGIISYFDLHCKEILINAHYFFWIFYIELRGSRI